MLDAARAHSGRTAENQQLVVLHAGSQAVLACVAGELRFAAVGQADAARTLPNGPDLQSQRGSQVTGAPQESSFLSSTTNCPGASRRAGSHVIDPASATSAVFDEGEDSGVVQNLSATNAVYVAK